MNDKSKISDLLDAVSNPISAAKNTVESTRGLVQETYGLVEDVREIADKEKQRREDKRQEREADGAKAKAKIAAKVAASELEKATIEYNSSVESNEAAMKAALLRQHQAEEEHKLVWSTMGQDEREAYLAEKRRQADEAIKEKLRIIRENDARKERNEMVFAVIFSIVFLLSSVWAFVLWLHYLTGKIPNVPGASWVR